MSEDTSSPEQVKDRDTLIALYGEAVFNQALELSGLALCLRALATDGEMNAGQREWLHQQASLHLAKLLEPLVPVAVAAKVAECSKRIESVSDQWMADELARARGL